MLPFIVAGIAGVAVVEFVRYINRQVEARQRSQEMNYAQTIEQLHENAIAVMRDFKTFRQESQEISRQTNCTFDLNNIEVDGIPNTEDTCIAHTNSISFNPSFTFENFVSKPSNSFALNAAVSITEKPAYNPLFLYGDATLDKTHLLFAIGNTFITKGKNVAYLTTERLLSDLVMQTERETIDGFIRQYSDYDLVLIDNIHLFMQEEIANQEFLCALDKFCQKGGQIVMTSDRHPKEIENINEKLLSLLALGLLADIQESTK